MLVRLDYLVFEESLAIQFGIDLYDDTKVSPSSVIGAPKAPAAVSIGSYGGGLSTRQ